MDLYEILKFFHVLMAIIAVGFNASYGIWIGRAAQDPTHLPHVLRGIKFLDDRVANPAYALLLLSGLGMVWESDLDLFGTFWLSTALGLFILTTLIAVIGYTPTLKKQIVALDTFGADSAEYKDVEKRGTTLGIVLALLVIAIVFLMVTKPT